MAYNHFVNHCRRHSPALEHEQPLYEDESAVLSRVRINRDPARWSRRTSSGANLLEMCPPARREVLELKRQGLPLAEIASRTGLHEGSVRRLLYDLAKRLAARSQASSEP